MTKTVLAFILCSAVVSSGLAQDSAPTVTKDVPDVTGNFERERETLRRMIAAGILAPPEP